MRLFQLPTSGLVAVLAFILSSSPLQAQHGDLEIPVDTTDEVLLAKGPVHSPITDAVLRERLNQLTGCVNMRVNGVVKGYVKHYAIYKVEKTRAMLSRRLTYFPLFEQKLKEYGLPTDLKYLSVVESALNPKAVSKVGATGLWQFMPSTGSEYGLRQNGTVDERSNPVESTDAAARYLKRLYSQYHDWALALAAYNSGPTRVSSAIKRSGSRNFWVIQRYLPEETRNYVPAFIAATYICNFFQLHGLNPLSPDLDEQLTTYVKVYDGMTFRDIEGATGVSRAVVANLNPGYKRGYITPSTEGQYVVLPQRVLPAFIRYLNSQSGARVYNLPENLSYVNESLGDGRYYQFFAQAPQAGHVARIAELMGTNGDQLISWNNLQSPNINAGQSLRVWRPVIVQKHTALKIEAPAATRRQTIRNFEPAPVRSPVVRLVARRTAVPLPQAPRHTAYQWHTLQRNESLSDLARQYNVSLDSLRKLNDTAVLKAGARIRIKVI
jgi:membrane-bound lytic murein transglycosylase D